MTINSFQGKCYDQGRLRKLRIGLRTDSDGLRRTPTDSESESTESESESTDSVGLRIDSGPTPSDFSDFSESVGVRRSPNRSPRTPIRTFRTPTDSENVSGVKTLFFGVVSYFRTPNRSPATPNQRFYKHFVNFRSRRTPNRSPRTPNRTPN